MSIQHLDLFHGAVLSKITRNKNNTISLIECDEKGNPSLYSVGTEQHVALSIMIKYASAYPKKNRWSFTNLIYRADCYFCLVCLEDRIIVGNTTMEICAIPPEKLKRLFSDAEIASQIPISCTVSLEKGKSFRVDRKKRGLSITVSRNQISKI